MAASASGWWRSTTSSSRRAERSWRATEIRRRVDCDLRPRSARRSVSAYPQRARICPRPAIHTPLALPAHQHDRESAKGAPLSTAWGNAPGPMHRQNDPALKARFNPTDMHVGPRGIETRFQRCSIDRWKSLGRLPQAKIRARLCRCRRSSARAHARRPSFAGDLSCGAGGESGPLFPPPVRRDRLSRLRRGRLLPRMSTNAREWR